MRHSEHRAYSGTIFAILLGASQVAYDSAAAVETSVVCKVLQATEDGIYVDIGTESGLKARDEGWLGDSRARVEVVKVTSRSTFVRILSGYSPGALQTGDDVTLIFDIEEPVVTPVEEEPPVSPTAKSQTEEEEFVPLLADPNIMQVASSDPSNIFHGRVTARGIVQFGEDRDNDYSIARLSTAGSLERIAGSPWMLEWAGQVYYRSGDELENIRDYEDLRLEAYRFSLYRRFGDRSFVRLGRFIPLELPGVGFLDGAQGEKVVSDTLRVGAMVGLKPNRITTELSVDEPTVVSYVTYEPEAPPWLSYSGTAGVLFSLYEGDPDRLAFLVDQKARFGDLSIYASSIVDFDVGDQDLRDDIVRLTWLTVNASYPVAPILELRAGVDKYELPYTEAERDLIRYGDLVLDDYFEQETWRYWAGASHRLPWNLRLTEKFSYSDTESVDGWRASAELTRRGLPLMPDATLTLSAYTMRAVGIDLGYGGRVSAYLPFDDHRFALLPAVTVRYAEFETQGSNFFDPIEDELSWIDLSLHARWTVSESWILAGGASYSLDDYNRWLVDVSATFRW